MPYTEFWDELDGPEKEKGMNEIVCCDIFNYYLEHHFKKIKVLVN